MNSRQQIHHKIFYYGLMLTAATLPYSLLANSISIIILVLNWIVEGNYAQKIKSIKNNLLFFIFISFYFLHVIGMIYTANTHDGIFELQKKLSLFILPFILATSPKLNSIEVKNILKSFASSVFIASFICLIYAFYRNYVDPFPGTDWLYFSYRDLTEVIHVQPTYLALFVSFTILILFFFILENFSHYNSFKKILSIGSIFYLIIFLFLTSARTEIAAFLIILFAGIIFFFYRQKKLLKGILILVATAVVLSLVMFQIPVIKERVYLVLGIKGKYEWIRHYGDGKTITPDLRTLKWQCASNIIKENWLLGVGTGDVQDELQKQYQKINFTDAFQQQFNAHNQFLETWLGIGILGLISFLSCIVTPLIIAFRQKNFLYVSFLILILICCLTESVFERQHGIVFYSLFTSLFAFHAITENKTA